MMRKCKFGGVNQSDMKLADIKKEVRKCQADAAKYMHENLSKASQGLDAQYLKDKAAKEEQKQMKLAADEMRKSYKGAVREEDLKLAEIRKEERLKKQAADENNRNYKGGVKEEDLNLAEIKKEARKQKQDAANFNHEALSKDSQALDDRYLKDKATKEELRQSKLAADEIHRGYKGGVKEDDLKLAEIKKEGRLKKQAADENNHGYKGGVSENDLKLAEIKKEGRQQKQSADEINHSYGGVKTSPVVDV